MTEGEKLTARERRKLLREFNELGRDAVRYNLQVGGYGVEQRRDLAFEWLREQEAEADKIRRWTLASTAPKTRPCEEGSGPCVSSGTGKGASPRGRIWTISAIR